MMPGMITNLWPSPTFINKFFYSAMEIEKSKISLKRASVSDIETLIEYRIIFLEETYGAPSTETNSRLRQSLKQYFTRSLKNDSFVCWIAEYENKPVGFSGMVIRDQPVTEPHDKALEINL
jgi:hypothetical protein